MYHSPFAQFCLVIYKHLEIEAGLLAYIGLSAVTPGTSQLQNFYHFCWSVSAGVLIFIIKERLHRHYRIKRKRNEPK